MAYAPLSVQPPHVHHNITRISPASALNQLQTYLEEAATKPHLQPNALLTLAGPTAAGGSEAGGLVLYNLRRLEAGLRGEVLAVDNGKPGDVPIEDLPNVAIDVEVAELEMDVDQYGPEDEGEWQDPGSYSRKQEVEVEDLGDRQTGIQDGGNIPAVRASVPSKLKDDKAGQKDEKKERKKSKKRASNEQNEEGQVSNKMSTTAGHATDRNGTDTVKSKKRKHDAKSKNLEQQQQRDQKSRSSQMPSSSKESSKNATKNGFTKSKTGVSSSLNHDQKTPKGNPENHNGRQPKASFYGDSKGTQKRETPTGSSFIQDRKTDLAEVHSEVSKSPPTSTTKKHKKKKRKREVEPEKTQWKKE